MDICVRFWRRGRLWGLCAVLIGWMMASPAVAQAQQEERAQATDSPVVLDGEQTAAAEQELPAEFEPGALPTLAAIFPGVLFHGTGLWLAGADEAAYELARIEAVGLLTMAAGIVGVYATGASRDTIELLYYPSLVGMSAFVTPWFADIYGSAVGGRQADARQALAPVEARAGYAYVYDPVFDYRHFSYAQAEVRLEPVRLVPSAWISVDDDNQRLRLEGIGRLLGPRASERATRPDGSFLDLETAVTYHNFSEGFQTLTLETQLAGRYDMRRLSPVLRGSFYELALGAGAQLFGYAVDDGELGEDVSALLLMRTAYGVYLGPSGDRYGEAKIYYDHRHDDFAAGININGQADGLMGHVGAKGFYYLGKNWGAFADLTAGSGYVALGGITFRYGGN